MGGFKIGLDGSSRYEHLHFAPRSNCLTLTARSIAPSPMQSSTYMQKEDIVDKSRADNLAKALVCVQVGWMVVQVTARVVLGLPVTLLEVNTLGHVLCALVIYVLWWHKPRLVREPTRLEGD
jgi:hypothetical protein